jgi:hypothetical protein
MNYYKTLRKAMAEQECIYRIPFMNKGEVYEIYAKGVANSDLYGFLEVEELVWGKAASVVIDPAEERLRNEFKDVSCVLIPLHSILRIDIVEKPGVAKITSVKEGSNVMPFPAPLYRPSPSGDKKE